jgi:DNA topoisomerase IA
MACQMEASRTDMIQVDIGNSEGDMIFHSSASRLDFKGYQAVYDVSCRLFLSMLVTSCVHSENPV